MAPIRQWSPPSSLTMSAAWFAVTLLPSHVSVLTPNTSRPACLPRVSWMPCTGPVAYQEFQCSGRISSLRSRGSDQVRPSSSLYWRCGVRSQGTVQLPASVRPVLYVSASRIRPVLRSTTGAGLPCVSPAPSLTTWSGPQVRPPSVERLRTMSMSAASPQLRTRPSAKASSVPAVVRTIAGIRKHA
ncbi:hypothetical protein SVIOM74S_05144 [Streptomyces violarus]